MNGPVKHREQPVHILKAFSYDEIKCGNKCTALQRLCNHTAKSEIIQESFVEPRTAPAALRRRRKSKSCERKRHQCWFAGWKRWHKKWKHFRVAAQSLKEAHDTQIKIAYFGLMERFLPQPKNGSGAGEHGGRARFWQDPEVVYPVVDLSDLLLIIIHRVLRKMVLVETQLNTNCTVL